MSFSFVHFLLSPCCFPRLWFPLLGVAVHGVGVCKHIDLPSSVFLPQLQWALRWQHFVPWNRVHLKHDAEVRLLLFVTLVSRHSGYYAEEQGKASLVQRLRADAQEFLSTVCPVCCRIFQVQSH